MDKLDDIQDYFENLASLHVDLQHNVSARRAFARFKTDEHIMQITKHATPNIVVIAEINGHRIGDIDSKEIRRGISIIFASRAATSGSAATTIDAANQLAEDIMFDFITQMHIDLAEECELQFDLDKLTWDDIEGPWLDNYYGWMLFVPFKGFLPLYNPDKWLS